MSTRLAAPAAGGWQRYVPWLAGLVAAGIAARHLLTTYADLGIYLDVARELRAGGFNLCRARDESGPWLYPPCAALPFVALEGWFGDTGARLAWSLGLGLATALLLRALAVAARACGGLRPWQWIVFGVLFQRCIAQNLTHGQLSLWVGALVSMGIAALTTGHDRRAGVLLGLGAMLKLTPLVFLAALPLMGRFRAPAAMAATIALGLLGAPWLYCGTAEHWRHLADFGSAVTASLQGSPDAVIDSPPGPSVAGTLDFLLQPRSADRDGRTVNVLAVGDGTLRAIKLGWSLLLGAGFAAWFLRARRLPTGHRLLEQAAAVTLAMSLFAPLLRVYHLAAALVPGMLFCRGPRDRRDLLWFVTATGLAFAMTLRQKGLLGASLWRLLDHAGLLHFALVAMLLWLARAAAPAPGAAR